MVSPSFTNTLAFASRLSSSKGITGLPLPDGTVELLAIELDLTLIFIKTKPSLDTWGVTVRMIPTGIFSVATAAPAADDPEPVAMFVELGNEIRKIRSLRMVDAMLFSVTTEGREIILILPSFSAASNASARFFIPKNLF